MPGASRVSIGVQPPGCGSFFVGGLIDRERGEPWEPNTHVPSDAPGARMSLWVAETGGTRVSGRDNAATRTLGTRLTGSRETSKVPSAIMRRGPFVSPRFLQSDADEIANRGRGRDHAGPGLTSASLGCLARAQREPHRSSRGGECFGRFAPPMHLDGRQRARLACFFQEGPRNGRRVREGDEGDQRESIWSNRLSHPVRMGGPRGCADWPLHPRWSLSLTCCRLQRVWMSPSPETWWFSRIPGEMIPGWRLLARWMRCWRVSGGRSHRSHLVLFAVSRPTPALSCPLRTVRPARLWSKTSRLPRSRDV